MLGALSRGRVRGYLSSCVGLALDTRSKCLRDLVTDRFLTEEALRDAEIQETTFQVFFFFSHDYLPFHIYCE